MELVIEEKRKSRGVERAPESRPVILRAPAVIKRNSASSLKDNIFVYWASPKGELQAAPDSRITQAQIDRYMPEYKGWKRCEATGHKEIEKVVVILARQEFENKKRQKVQQHLRENEFVRQLQVRCRLRLAQGYSKNDVEMNKKIMARARHSEKLLYDAIVSEFDPTRRTHALEAEVHEQSTSPVAHFGKKHEGIS
jgi:hypothetical protein